MELDKYSKVQISVEGDSALKRSLNDISLVRAFYKKFDLLIEKLNKKELYEAVKYPVFWILLAFVLGEVIAVFDLNIAVALCREALATYYCENHHKA